MAVLSDCQKTCSVTGIGGKDSVKGNRQGSLSRSITRRSDQKRPKLQNKILFFILQFCLSLSKKSERTFLTSWENRPMAVLFFYFSCSALHSMASCW